ncbi:hypothetical protein Y032_0086g1950 [Ancylostoma ceylanicum]|uniref:Crustacean CHH/MIH/GIH neurohormone family protein n=1 Tax=Ancylostoma ceylanicum TaxID=53326 RepID=A0A016TQJ2_9BILA|nr:hypothetical protein Y032_0086g1950 [Ancylostoma ceylanicum]
MIVSTTAQPNWARQCIIAVALCFVISESRTIVRGLTADELPQYLDSPKFIRVRKEEWIPDSDCNVHQHEVLHAVMDRLCEVCHEMFFHQEGSLRSQCRMGCFDNDVFRKCLHVFSSIEDKDIKNEKEII